jgi:hypothetical protein
MICHGKGYFCVMTLDEFNALDLTEKAEAVWRGTLLAER